MKNKKLKYNGLWPVMLTPFRENKNIDFPALEQLTDFYLESGASGLFANCLSSEMYDLTEKERLAIIRAVVKRVRGKVPVAATGTFGGSLHLQAEFIKKVHDQGADIPILITSFFARKDQDESSLRKNILKLAGLVGSIPLGLYECPVPYKRIISEDLTSELALTGQFFYLKDTTCNIIEISGKIKAASGTTLAVFNANTPTALDSLKSGADGLSAISANFYPEFYSWICKHFKNRAKALKVSYLSDELTLMDAVTRINYPISAKVFLSMRGLRIKPVVRTVARNLNAEEKIMLNKLYQMYLRLVNEYV